MSTQAAGQPAEKTAEEIQQIKQASAQVLDNIFYDVFLNKIAECGITPRSREEAIKLINIGLNIEKFSQHPAIKKASQKGNILDFATQRLHEKMASLGIPHEGGEDASSEVEQLSLAYTRMPAVQEAVLNFYGE